MKKNNKLKEVKKNARKYACKVCGLKTNPLFSIGNNKFICLNCYGKQNTATEKN